MFGTRLVTVAVLGAAWAVAAGAAQPAPAARFSASGRPIPPESGVTVFRMW
jgi:hypothetical protein